MSKLVIKVMFYEEGGKIYKFSKPVKRSFVDVNFEVKDGFILVSKGGFETEKFISKFCKIVAC